MTSVSNGPCKGGAEHLNLKCLVLKYRYPHPNNFGLYAGLYRFGEQENQMKGYRLRGEFLIDLTRKSHLIFSPEFFTDNIRNHNFAGFLGLS